jgi:hypothetical protein
MHSSLIKINVISVLAAAAAITNGNEIRPLPCPPFIITMKTTANQILRLRYLSSGFRGDASWRPNGRNQRLTHGHFGLALHELLDNLRPTSSPAIVMLLPKLQRGC